MTECLPDLPRYIRQQGARWEGADHPDGPWRPIPAPQSGMPWEPGKGGSNTRTPRIAKAGAEGIFISFGGASIDEQLKSQEFKLDMDSWRRAHLQRDANEVTRLRVRGILTKAESDKARNRIFKIIIKHAKPL